MCARVASGSAEMDQGACKPHLHAGRVEPVVPVDELNDGLLAVPHGAVVLHAEVLQGLHQAPRHVARLGGLDGRVDQPLCRRERGRRAVKALVRQVFGAAFGVTNQLNTDCSFPA